MRKAIAIDFDGCLCENKWPEIGEPHWPVIRAAQSAQREGAALILWTCRCGDLLDVAVEWCRDHDLIFDTINENLPERLEHYGSESRKISADEYWDDRAVHMPAPPNSPLTLDELLGMDGEQVWIDRPDGSEDCNGWVRVELVRPWKPCGLEPHVFVVSPNGNRDYVGLLLECGDKIYRYKPEEKIRAKAEPATPSWAEHLKTRFLKTE